jgi:hypothetical protein
MVGPGRSWPPPADGWPAVRRKGHGHKGPTVEKKRRKRRNRDYVLRGTPKGPTFENRRRARPKRNNGIRDRDLGRELRLGSKETFSEALGQTHELEVVKRAVGLRLGCGEWVTGHVEGSAPSETKETSKAQPSEKNEDDGGTPGPPRTLSRNGSGRAALRKEQREQLGSNYSENRATGKKGEVDHRRHKHSPRKKINVGTPIGY